MYLFISQGLSYGEPREITTNMEWMDIINKCGES